MGKLKALEKTEDDAGFLMLLPWVTTRSMFCAEQATKGHTDGRFESIDESVLQLGLSFKFRIVG
jgi:hypothetical protein